ncbi:MAG TPA: SusC/RagA family TonB-linked outer membrane protein, partial [Parafilimonas sp.]
MQTCIVAALPTVFKTKRLKKYFLFFISMLTLLHATAQNTIEIKGKVTDDKGAPLNGASIILKGSKTGTVTNNNGDYSFTINNAGTLIFSYAGYINKEVAVTNSQTLNISLVASNTSLNDVVVTGYSRQSKRDITGAASTISAETIAQTPVTDLTGVIQGRVSGVSVDAQGGPGNPQVIRIRGIGTLGDNDPLYVIDGVQIRMGSGGQSQDISTLINPNDIESMTILKDPSLISLYGAEGANGVIVITTKTGKLGAPKLEYDAYIGQEIPKKLPAFITPQQQADALYKSFSIVNQPIPASVSSIYGTGTTPILPDYIVFTGATSFGAASGDASVDPSLYNLKTYRIVQTDKTGNNWFKVLFKPATTQNHQLSLSGANDKSNYALTLGYLDDQGTEVNSYFKRMSLRVNTEFKIKPWLRIGENTEMSYATANSGERRTFNTFNNDIGAIYSFSPLLSTYDIAGNITGTKGSAILGGGNPLISRTNSSNSKSYAQSIIGAAYAEAEPIKGLVYTNQITFQFVPSEYHYFTPADFQDPLADTSNTFGEGGAYSTDWRWLNKIAYSTTINSIHKIAAFAGYETHQFVYRGYGGTTGNLAFPSTNNEYLSSGNSGTGTFFTPTVNGSGDKYTNTAILANVTYSLLDKYLFTATGRRDGSSKFGPDNRFGNFGSVSGGWRISKEAFMDNVAWINDLKLRASYGTIGNDAIGTGIYEDVYTSDAFGNYDLGGTNTSSMSGYYLALLGNPQIKWETNKTTNLGFDATLFKTFTASFSWFNRASSGVLYAPPSSGTQGSAAS